MIAMTSVPGAAEELAVLLARAGSGDQAAFSRLYARTFSRLMSVVSSVVGRQSMAQDALQEAYLSIWRDAALYDQTRAAPMTWMAMVARNRAIDWLRKDSTRNRLIDRSADADEHDHPCALLGPCGIVEGQQQSRQIRVELDLLDLTSRTIIELAFFEGLSHTEVAVRLSMPLGTVKTHIRRGCQKMRAHIC
jgi:RNA polymerase sigma-70 factor (ECF subfamily)